MSSIGGPGGIGGPTGPKGPDDVSAPVTDVGAAADVGDIGQLADAAPVDGSMGTSDIDALATEVAAGRLTPQEAIDRLVEATAGPELGPAERAELRELLDDLVASDPYFGSLIGRVG